MGDLEYEKEYLKKKKKLKLMYTNLKNSKEIQEIYHKIMGSNESTSPSEVSSKNS